MLAALIMAFSACQITGCNYTSLEYDDAIKYKKGGASIEGTISAIDVEWLTGSVQIEYNDQEEISFYESANEEIDDKHQLRYYVEGDELHIKFGRQGKYTLGIGAINKDLVICIPRGMVLDKIEVESVSADITTKGTLDFKNASFEAVSGDITVLIGKADDVDAETVSGKISASMKAVSKAEISTASGNITIDAEEIKNCEIDSVSGEVYLNLFKGYNYSIKCDSVSGHVYSTVQDDIQGDDLITLGKKESSYIISTVSSSINICIPNID